MTEITVMEHTSAYHFIARTLRDFLKCVSYHHQQSRDRYVYNIFPLDYLGRHPIKAASFGGSLGT